MSADEAVTWRLYRDKRGGLNPLLRNEAGHAMLAGLICTAAQIKDLSGRPMTMADFLPHARDPEPEEFASKDEIIRMFPRVKH